jgi:hypothetical protein
LVWRRGADHRSRHQCVAEQPSCASTFTTMYYCSTFCLAGRAQLSHNVDPLGRAALPTIDLASRARWSRRRVLQGCLRCTSTSCCCVTRRALMLDNVDPLRRARSVDHRCLRPCTVASPSCTPRLPTMYQYSLLSSGETSADVGQCRLVLMRGAVSTRDLAAHARWHRRRVRHGCLRCNSVRCCCLVERAQMMVNADSSRRVTQCRPSTSPPVHGGAAFVSANVAYDVPVLAVVVWWD